MGTYRQEYNMKRIGDNLRRLREAKNLSVEEVRSYLRLGSVQAVYKYERGSCYPQTDTMLALMELYDAELQDIIGNAKQSDESQSHMEYVIWQRKGAVEYLRYYAERFMDLVG